MSCLAGPEADRHRVYAGALPGAGLFWILGFVYASLMALLLQKVILPLMPELHAGHGLLQNDAIVFHNIAVHIATKIQANGWSEWMLFPPGATGNVGLLAALYAVLGSDPAWFIPFNAAAHAAGALLIFRLGAHLWPGYPGRVGGLIAGITFLVFPSALQWYGQNHKDAFAIAGTLLVLDAWLQTLSGEGMSSRRLRLVVAQMAAGSVLLGLVRPYYVVLLLAGLCAAWLADMLVGYLRWRSLRQPNTARQLLLLVMLAAIAAFFANLERASVIYTEAWTNTSQITWQWHTTEILPHPLENTLHRASELRAHFVAFGRQVGAGSEIDGDRLPDNAWSAIAYLPRALFVGLMAPFPDTWAERVTAPRLIGAMETALWYLFALGAAVLVWRRPSRELLAGVVFCATLLTILAYIHPNVGTLYRQRYALWHFFLLCGSVGWVSLMTRYFQQRRHPGTARANCNQLAPTVDLTSVNKLASAGFVVILITLVCYLGFFARDLLMIQHLGMTKELDAFFTAAMIPMFFVTCLAMPMADALTPGFLELLKQGTGTAARLLRCQLGFAVLLLGGTTLLVVLFAPRLIDAILGAGRAQDAASAVTMLRSFAPILLLAAWTIVGNTALNALGRQRDAALGQLFVPAATIGLLVLMPSSSAVTAAIAGMLSGALLNVLWVVYRLKSQNLNFIPAMPALTLLTPVFVQYRRLLLAATLPAVLVPINYAFAAAVTAGALSVWAFASKVIVLFSGLASVAATSVVLPHLSRLFADRQHHSMRHDANLLLALGVWAGGLLAVGGFLFAEPLVATALAGNIAHDQLSALANILEVGVIQLPMTISWSLMAKMAIVSGNSSRVMYAALLGFLANMLINLWLVPQLGVLGVAVGAVGAVFASNLLLLLVTYRQVGLTLRELLTVLGGWGVWTGVCVALKSHSNAAVVISIIAVAGLIVAQYLSLDAADKVPEDGAVG